MKKVVASVLTLAMVLSVSTSAFAADPLKLIKDSKKVMQKASANDPYEPNDDLAFATYINSNVSYFGEIGHVKDTDIFKFYAKPGELKFLLTSTTAEKGQFTVIVQKEGTTGQYEVFDAVNGVVNGTFQITTEGTYWIGFIDKRALNSKPFNPVPYALKAIFNQ